MVHLSTWQFLLLAGLAGTATAQSDLFQYMGQMPQCGIACVLQEVPKSACNSVANTTCICSDLDFYHAVQECVQTTCVSTLDAIDVARIEAEACQRPYRDRRSEFNAVLAVLLIGFVAVWLRLYARWSTVGKFDTDDWIMLVCGMLYSPFLIIGQYGGRIAFGRDIWTVDPDDLTLGLQIFYVAQSFYLVCLGLTKLSLLCFFLRIFPNKTFRLVVYATMLVTALSTTIFVFLQIFQCVPVSYNWEGWKGEFDGSHRCVDVNRLVVSAASFSIFLDVVIIVLPLPLLLGLKMSWHKKAGIVLMFSLGIFILIIACIRLQYIVRYVLSSNPTWDHTDVLHWSGFEVAVSMIVTSLPALRILFRRCIPEGLVSSLLSKTGMSGKHGSRKEKLKQVSAASTNTAQPGTLRDPETILGDDEDYKPSPMPPAPPAETRPRKLVSKFSPYKLGGRRNMSESEEQLELGDRNGGGVYTEIAATDSDRTHGRAMGRYDDLWHMRAEERGIQVHTTTRVDSRRGRA